VLFRRRKPDGLFERVRTYLWPRRSFSRSLQYFSKRTRLKATLHAVVAGVAAGRARLFRRPTSSSSPSWLADRRHLVAAAFARFCNPLTFPALWGASRRPAPTA
jgi:uncharacterized protein (DUF2062 family)